MHPLGVRLRSAGFRCGALGSAELRWVPPQLGLGFLGSSLGGLGLASRDLFCRCGGSRPLGTAESLLGLAWGFFEGFLGAWGWRFWIILAVLGAPGV